MNIILLIIIWIIAGALARAVVPSAEGRGGILLDLIVGLVGGVIGGWVFRLVLGHAFYSIIGSIVVAFVGGVILLLIVRAFTGRGRRTYV